MAFHKIITVKALPGRLLLADFADGKQTVYSAEALFDALPAFRDLRDIPGLFEQVRVDAGGHGISWNDSLDLDAEELYCNGTETRQPARGCRGEVCRACDQRIRRISPKAAAASRINGRQGGRPKKTAAAPPHTA